MLTNDAPSNAVAESETSAPADAGAVEAWREVHAALHAMGCRAMQREQYPDEYERVIAAVLTVEMAAEDRALAAEVERDELRARCERLAVTGRELVEALDWWQVDSVDREFPDAERRALAALTTRAAETGGGSGAD